jgi:hypothetical protein
MRVRLNRCHLTGASNRSEVPDKSFVGFNRASSLVDSTTYRPTGTANSLSKTAAATATFKSTIESLSNRKHNTTHNHNNGQMRTTTFTLQNRNYESMHLGDDI